MYKAFCAALVVFVTAASASFAQSAPPPPDVVTDLAPSGRLHAAINAGNVVLVQKNQNGAPTGITVDLAQELAKRLGVPVDLVVFEAAGKVTDAVKSGTW